MHLGVAGGTAGGLQASRYLRHGGCMKFHVLGNKTPAFPEAAVEDRSVR